MICVQNYKREHRYLAIFLLIFSSDFLALFICAGSKNCHNSIFVTTCGLKKEDFKLSKLHHKSRLSVTYQPRPMKLTRRPWLFRISQKPNPTIVYFSSPDPAMAFLSASASFSGSKLSAGFNVPWNSAWKKEFEMHKVQVTVRATYTSVRWIMH